MKNLSKETKKLVKDELNRVAAEMMNENVTPDRLKELREKYQTLDEMLKTNWHVDGNTILIVAGNLLGILLILKYEQLEIVTSKAISFVLKGRV